MGIIAYEGTTVIKLMSLTAEEIAAVGHISFKISVSFDDEIANIRYEALTVKPKYKESSKVDLR